MIIFNLFWWFIFLSHHFCLAHWVWVTLVTCSFPADAQTYVCHKHDSWQLRLSLVNFWEPCITHRWRVIGLWIINITYMWLIGCKSDQMLSDDWLVDEFEAMDLSRSCLSDAKAFGFHPRTSVQFWRYHRTVSPGTFFWLIAQPDKSRMLHLCGEGIRILYRCATWGEAILGCGCKPFISPKRVTRICQKPGASHSLITF